MGMLLGYARVSTTDQHGRLQFDALTSYGVAEERIWFDQITGAKSARERPAMSELLKYAREGDEIVVYRIDRLGRSMLDILNTVALLTERKIGLRSLVDNIDPSTPAGRLQLGLFATLAEYERELTNERVRAGIMAAKERGVRFGQKPVDPDTVQDKVELARQMLADGKTGERVAKAVGWSRATLYRYLRQYGAETPIDAQVAVGRARSRYADVKTLPPRD
ncbi:recombinase family protein [Tersicoccus sp. MR15.9]|uniref:recombinase family protein n=1 Tax=Tersicoccus mangrovi TaxID=3121635 RepID=UPI002FE66E3F